MSYSTKLAESMKVTGSLTYERAAVMNCIRTVISTWESFTVAKLMGAASTSGLMVSPMKVSGTRAVSTDTGCGVAPKGTLMSASGRTVSPMGLVHRLHPTGTSTRASGYIL